MLNALLFTQLVAAASAASAWLLPHLQARTLPGACKPADPAVSGNQNQT
jgi:hypothetical protein